MWGLGADETATIRELGEQLDRHDDLPMIALYSVLKKEGRALNQDDPQGAREDLDESERENHKNGLVGILRAARRTGRCSVTQSCFAFTQPQL